MQTGIRSSSSAYLGAPGIRSSIASQKDLGAAGNRLSASALLSRPPSFVYPAAAADAGSVLLDLEDGQDVDPNEIDDEEHSSKPSGSTRSTPSSEASELSASSADVAFKQQGVGKGSPLPPPPPLKDAGRGSQRQPVPLFAQTDSLVYESFEPLLPSASDQNYRDGSGSLYPARRGMSATEITPLIRSKQNSRVRIRPNSQYEETCLCNLW
ncbi:hypothetical protein DFJ73DRAFT_837794 [Zopfochytrium polystomum]|nr:hypothetical protein DFJ73DRAFT_837794 [Zopfochytrium polystomum]